MISFQTAMGERKPTIEQNSQFTAKTKQGQDVEFQTTVKFYISPRGDVRVNVPGGPRVRIFTNYIKQKVDVFFY